jgi:hypothetical protein
MRQVERSACLIFFPAEPDADLFATYIDRQRYPAARSDDKAAMAPNSRDLTPGSSSQSRLFQPLLGVYRANIAGQTNGVG